MTKALNHEVEKIHKKKDKLFLYNVGKEKYVIPLSRIVYFHVKKRIIDMCFVSDEGEYKTVMFYSTLGSVKNRLDGESFFSPSCSYLVNFLFVNKAMISGVTLSNGESIPVSRNYRKKISQDFEEFFETSDIVLV